VRASFENEERRKVLDFYRGRGERGAPGSSWLPLIAFIKEEDVGRGNGSLMLLYSSNGRSARWGFTRSSAVGFATQGAGPRQGVSGRRCAAGRLRSVQVARRGRLESRLERRARAAFLGVTAPWQSAVGLAGRRRESRVGEKCRGRRRLAGSQGASAAPSSWAPTGPIRLGFCFFLFFFSFLISKYLFK
jgi:hypothetical protein